MNKKVITEKLLQAIFESENAISLKDDQFLSENEELLKDNLASVIQAFSGSWMGYHANVYYRDMRPPTPGDHFSPEWGLMPGWRGDCTSRNWVEYSPEDVRTAIMTGVKSQYEDCLADVSARATQVLEDKYETVRTILDALLAEYETPTLQRINDDLNKIEPNITTHEVLEAMVPKGQVVTRDSKALSQGFITPMHCIVQAEQIVLRHSFDALESLTGCSRRILKYMEINDLIERADTTNGDRVFIGHGRSPLWRELKDFIQDRLHLEWEEFNREPTAGMATIERLQLMLNGAAFSFLVMTAENDHADKTMHARENVVHEVGLFQGRLGFRKAIVILEEGCSEFSNIMGLNQIRFPSGNISACFEDVRKVLEREGLL